jgi:hypothetical protein
MDCETALPAPMRATAILRIVAHLLRDRAESDLIREWAWSR